MAPAMFAKALKTACIPVILLVPMAGCATTDRIVTSSIPMDDYHVRHPIVIAEDRSSLDVFPSLEQGRLDRHTAKQVYALALQYRELGHGPILILVPRNRGEDASHIIADIRHVLIEGGARSGIEVSSYPVGSPGLAAPIRISYVGTKANVADQCGQWPKDLASGSTTDTWQNQSYWNFGCATQTMIATQTSDPRDLVTPRGEEPSDVQIRSRAIESVRKGSDPNTSWTVKNSSIGQVGG